MPIPTNLQKDAPAAPPQPFRQERPSDTTTSIFREGFASPDTVQEKEENTSPLERLGTMTSVEFLLAHQPSRPQPGRIENRKSFLAGLIKPPTVRQFLHEDQLFTEKQDRSLTQFELFADLVFVAIVHLLGDVAAEEPSIFNVLQFMLILWPPWAIWADMRSYINTSGTDDFIQRIYILLTSILLVGYTAQAASLKVEIEVEGVPESEEQMSIFILDDQGYKTLQWAVAFFLLARLLRLAITLGYAWFLPKFRAAHLVQAANILIPCICFLPLFAVRSVGTAVAVFIVGVVCEIAGKYVAALVISWIKARNPENVFVPAQEIGHAIEKTSAFFVLMCGEILFSVAYVVKSEDEIGLNGAFARASLGLILSFLLAWLYFDADSSRFYIHALRRHWWTSISWTQLHLPLSGAIVLVAAALDKMVKEKEIDQGHRWYFGVGMGTTMLCFTAIGFLHRSLDGAHSTLLRRWIRLCVRVVFALLFITFPLFPNNNAVSDLAINTSLLASVVISETIGKISTRADELESGTVSKEERALAAGFNIADLTPFEKGKDEVDIYGTVGILRSVSLPKHHRKALATAV